MEDLDTIDKLLENGAKQSILQEMGLQNLNNYLILDERQEEAKRIAANATPKKFSEMVDKLSEAFTGGVWNASDLFDRTFRNLKMLETGIVEYLLRVDNMLSGGLLNNRIIEVTGVSGSGKTRFCFKLVLQTLGTTSHKILYIDSGASFSIERLEFYCNKFGMTQNSKQREILRSRMRHVVATKPMELIFTLISVLENMKKGKFELDLIIIDCLSSIMNINSELSEYEEYLTEVYRLLKVINTTHAVGILVTTTAKLPTVKSQKPKSLLSTPWNFMPQVSMLIENMNPEMKVADTQKGFYRITLLSLDFMDDCQSVAVQINMRPFVKKD